MRAAASRGPGAIARARWFVHCIRSAQGITMKTLPAIILSLAFTAPLTITSAVRADDKTAPSSDKQDVTMDQLPAAVKATAQRECKDKNVESLTKSTKNGAIAYELKYLDGSKETTVDIAANGKVIARHNRAVGTEPGKNDSSAPKSDSSIAPKGDPSTPPRNDPSTPRNEPPMTPRNDSKPDDSHPRP
jgi:hypothetical protein